MDREVVGRGRRVARGRSAAPGAAARLPARSVRTARRSEERRREVFQALQVVHRPELVHVGKEGADPGRLRREALVAEQGVQPHEAAARLAEPLHLGPDAFARVAVESVGDEQHHRALAAHPAGPVPVEPVETLPDARAPAPVFHLLARALHRRVHVAPPKLAGDVGEPGAEDEGVHAAPVSGEGVREVEQQPRVAAHRPRDVAEHDDGGGLSEAPPPDEQDLAGAVPETAPKGGPHVHERAVRVRPVTAGRGGRNRELEPRDRRLRLRELRGRHLLEVAGAQDLPVRPGEGGIELDLLLRLPGARLAFGPGEERFAQPSAEGPRIASRWGVDGGEEEARDAFEEPRVSPEDVERLVEQRPLIGPSHEDRVQGPVEVVAPGEAHRLHRPKRLEHRAASHRKARAPQRASEVHEVGGEPTGRASGPVPVSGGGRPRDPVPRGGAGGIRRRPQP